MKQIARIVVLCGLASLLAAAIGMGCTGSGRPSEQDRKDFTGADLSPADKAKLNAAMTQKAFNQMKQQPPSPALHGGAPAK